MADTIDAALLRKILNDMADIIIANRDRLNEIDAGIGDADHGTGLAQSMTKAREKLAANADDAIAACLKAFGSGIMGGGGGASGALFSGVFTEGAKLMAGKDVMTPADLAAWWRAGLDIIQARGKAKVGDKTMVDALDPAVKALEENTAAGLKVQTEKAYQAALEGVEATKNMVAGQGRSRYAGERSIGHQDAGATSVSLVFEVLAKAVS